MCDPIKSLATNLKNDFSEMTKENRILKDQNRSRRVLINQMVGRIKDLEAESRDLDMQNFRLKNRIRVITEHKQETDRSRREGSAVIEELYQDAMRKFEKLQMENERIKLQLKNLEQRAVCNVSKCSNCPRLAENYNDLVKTYEAATQNFLSMIQNLKDTKEQNCNKTTECNLPSNEPPPPPAVCESDQLDDSPGCPLVSDVTKNSCSIDGAIERSKAFLSMKSMAPSNNCTRNNTTNQVLLLGQLEALPDNAFIPHIPEGSICSSPQKSCALSGGGKERSSLSMASNVSTRGTTLNSSPPPTYYDDIYEPNGDDDDEPKRSEVAIGTCPRKNKTECAIPISEVTPTKRQDTGREGCSHWPDERRPNLMNLSILEKMQKDSGCPLVENRDKTVEPSDIDDDEDDDDDMEEAEQNTCGCANKNTSKVQFKCHACSGNEKAEVATECNCVKKTTCNGGCPRNITEKKKESIQPPQRVMKRRGAIDQDSSTEELLQDMIQADNENRLQRSATPEPSSGRIHLGANAGVVSYSSPPKRSQSQSDRERSMGMACERRGDSLPKIIQSKLASVGKFVGDVLRTLTSPSKSSIEAPSVPEVKLRGTPMRSKKQCSRG